MKQYNTKHAKELTDFGKKVGRLRIEAKLERDEFAEKCGMSYKHYFNIENGVERPSLLSYIAICRALGIKEIPLVGV